MAYRECDAGRHEEALALALLLLAQLLQPVLLGGAARSDSNIININAELTHGTLESAPGPETHTLELESTREKGHSISTELLDNAPEPEVCPPDSGKTLG